MQQEHRTTETQPIADRPQARALRRTLEKNEKTTREYLLTFLKWIAVAGLIGGAGA